MVDYYSEYSEMVKLRESNGTAVIRLVRWFSTHGIPNHVTSDNGPHFIGSGWSTFPQDYGFQNVTLSPLHPKPIGMAEKAEGIAKAMLVKCMKEKQTLI